METGANKALLHRAFYDEEVVSNTSSFILGLVLSSKEIKACLTAPETKKIAAIWKMPMLHTALHELQQQLTSLKMEPAEVEVSFSTPYWTLLPKGIFQEDSAPAYLKFNHSPPENWKIDFEPVLGLDATNIFAFDSEWREMVINIFPRSRFSHQHTHYLAVVLEWARQQSEQLVFLNREPDHAQVTVFRSGTLVLSNAFVCQSEEDILFFVLYTIRQLHLNTSSIKLYLSGLPLTEGSSELLKKYTQSLKTVSAFVDNEQVVPEAVLSEYFIAANLMLCG